MPLSITGIATGGDFSATDACGSTLAVGANCNVGITFTPSEDGVRNNALQVTDNAPGSPQVVALIGTGVGAPQVTGLPANLTFTVQPVGSISSSQTVTLTNSGNAPLMVTSIAASGDFAQTDTCGSIVSAGGNCTMNVTFTPTATGNRMGTLTIADNASNSPQTVTLSGTGTPAPLAITASSGSMTYGGTPPTITPGYSGFVNGDTAGSLTTPPTCSTTVTSQSPVGSYSTNCSGAVDSNYTISYVPGNVTVGKASLTITASNGTMTYGGTPPAVTPSYSPFAGSDTVASLTTAPTCSTTATSSTPAGTDTGANTCSGAVDPNYSFTYVTGNVTVSKATPTITWATPASITSGTALSSTQLDATASVPGTFVYSPAAGTTPAAGMDTLSVTFTPTDTTDYNTATATVTLAVADFTFTAPSGSSTSATAPPGQPATYTLSVGGEGGMSGTVTFTCTGAPSEATCTVSPNPVTAGNSATNVTVSVTTTAASFSAPRSRPLPPVPPLSPGLRGLLMLALVLAAMAWGIVRRNLPGLSRWKTTMAPLAAGLLLTLAVAGCGGGGGGGGGAVRRPTLEHPPGPTR
jgi:azurin